MQRIVLKSKEETRIIQDMFIGIMLGELLIFCHDNGDIVWQGMTFVQMLAELALKFIIKIVKFMKTKIICGIPEH